jgi:hypothetical protein
VTFLFTDMDGSTRRWDQDPVAMRATVTMQGDVVRGAIETNDGRGRGGRGCSAELDGVAMRAGS